MDKRLKSVLCLLIVSLMVVTSYSSCPCTQTCKNLGPPEVTLNCLADYVKLNKVVEVLWRPTLESGSITPPSSVHCCIGNCEAIINCSHGYRSVHPCPHESEANITLESFLKWKFPAVWFHETLCSVKVSYVVDCGHIYKEKVNSKICSYSAPNLLISNQNSLVNATVGKPYQIQCNVSTSEKINTSILKIHWSGPNGSITNDNRISIHPTVSDDGIVHNSTLQFLYLDQNDTGAFVCNVTILYTNVSETLIFPLDNITSFGPPSVTLKCLVDYVKLNKTIEVSWKPTLLSSATHLSTENINEPAQAYIKCKGGYNHTHEFASYNETGDLYMRWNFSIPNHEKFCSVQVGYLDFVDYYQAVYQTIKNCSFSGGHFVTSPTTTANITTSTTITTTAITTAITTTTSITATREQSSSLMMSTILIANSNVSISAFPTVHSTTYPSSSTKNTFTEVYAGSCLFAITVSIIIGILLLFFLIGVIILYRFRRNQHLKIQSSIDK